MVEGTKKSGVVESKEEGEGRGSNGGGRGKEEGEALKNKQVQEGGEKERGEEEGEGGKVADILAGDHSSSVGHQSALLLCVPAKISTGK